MGWRLISGQLFEQTPQVIVQFVPFEKDSSHENILTLSASLCWFLAIGSWLRFYSRNKPSSQQPGARKNISHTHSYKMLDKH